MNAYSLKDFSAAGLAVELQKLARPENTVSDPRKLPLILAAEQTGTRIVLLAPECDWSRPDAIRWSWSPLDRPLSGTDDCMTDSFSCICECKLRRTADGRPVLLTNASGGGVALIDIRTKEWLFYGWPGGNTHSCELLPDGSIATASSTGNKLTLFLREPDRIFPASMSVAPFDDAHGLQWDAPGRQLWALGHGELATFRPENGTLIKIKSFELPEFVRNGHDLTPVWPGSRLLLLTGTGVALFDPETECFYPLFEKTHVKSVALSAPYPDGVLMVQRPTESWWSDRLFLMNPAAPPLGCLPGARFYKARWVERSAFF